MPSFAPPSAETTEQLLAHTEWLRRVARALTTSADDADDVVQQTWLAAIERPPAHSGNLRGWLATLARNFVRSRSRSRERESARERALPPPPPAPTPAESVARAELQQAVLDAVLALAEPYRATLVQRYCDDLSADEIARRASVPVETVRTRIKRGLDQVRTDVAKRLGGEREQLAALLAPLIAAGVVTMSTTVKFGGLAVAAALIVATFVVLRGHDGQRARAVDERVARPSAAASPVTVAPAEVGATRSAEAAAAPAPDAAEPDTDAATPRGFVVSGSVLDEDGVPVAGATVLLGDREKCSVDLGRIARWNCGREEVAQLVAAGDALVATTDVHGEFELPRVDGVRQWNLRAFDAKRGVAEGVAIEPTGEPPHARIETELRRGVGVRGQVVDRAGNPAPRARVQVVFVAEGRRDAVPIRLDDAARFDIPALPVPMLFLSAVDEARQSATERIAFDPVRSTDPEEIVLRLGGATRPKWICGRVLAPDSAPLVRSHAIVASCGEWEWEGWSSATNHVAIAVADAGGASPPVEIASSVAWIDLETGTYRCRVPRWPTPFGAKLVFVMRGRVVALATLSNEDLRDDGVDRTGPDLVVDPSRIPVRPASAALDVSVEDAATGKPFTHEELVVSVVTSGAGRPARLPATSPDPRTLTTRIAPIAAPHAIVRAFCPGYAPGWIELDIEPRAAAYPVTVVIEQAVRTIRGKVVGPNQRPVAGACIRWLENGSSGWRRSAAFPSTTDSEGRFALAQVGTKGGRVAVESPDFVPGFIDIATGTMDEAADVTLSDGAPVTFSLEAETPSLGLAANLRISTRDGTVVWQDWGAAIDGWRWRWPRRLVLAPGAYDARFVFLDADPVDKSFVASSGAEIVVAPRAR